MTLVVLVGGARSGKSTLAVQRARAQGGPVTFIATGEARDEEMAERIARHQAERPPEWTTVEEPVELGRALAGVPGDHAVIVDCLSLWIANGGDGAVPAAREGRTMAVTNEGGPGSGPPHAVARAARGRPRPTQA